MLFCELLTLFPSSVLDTALVPPSPDPPHLTGLAKMPPLPVCRGALGGEVGTVAPVTMKSQLPDLCVSVSLRIQDSEAAESLPHLPSA